MAKDTKGNLFEKVAVVSGITFVREFRPYSDDAEWGNLRFYSIYAGDVITSIELGEFEARSWDKFSEVDSIQAFLGRTTLIELQALTRERIEELAGLGLGEALAELALKSALAG
jgi:hypothetical protein